MCGPTEDLCKKTLKKSKSFRLQNVDTGCAAAVKADTSKVATNDGECDTVIGAECDCAAVEESARVQSKNSYTLTSLAC